MTDGGEAQHVTRSELLTIREESWSQPLASVSLVAECIANAEETEQTLEVMGSLFRERTGSQRGRLLRRWPAVHVMATTMVATSYYDGSFWPTLAEMAGIEQTQAMQSEWGGAYLDNLRTLGLPTFSDSDDAGSRYVGRVLMHSGIPTVCLGDFFRTLSEQRSAIPGLTSEEFVGWSGTAKLYNVDKPVVRFLRYGGEYAVDVVDRSFELLDMVSSGGTGQDALLPQRFREAAYELHLRGQIVRAARRRGGHSSAEADSQPVLSLDPYGRGVFLKLPAVSEAPDGRAVWSVTMDDHSTRVETKALWPGSLEPAPPTAVSISSPVREATTTLEGWEHLVTRLRVVDDQLPLLAFDTSGAQLPPGLAWRAQSAWLLFPEAEQRLVVSGDLEEIYRGTLPPGWAGWSLVLADLSAVDSLSVEGSVRQQQVRRNFSASIELDKAEPVPGIQTEGGEAVWPIVPGVTLPEEAGPDAEWQVSILDGTGAVLASAKYFGGGDATDIWDEIEGHLLGTYTVRVRGPWGKGCTRTFTLVEGLETQISPPWRRLAEGGLVTASVEVTGPEALQIEGRLIELKSDRAKASVRMRSQGGWRSFVVEPPHMSVMYQTPSTNLGPAVNPIALYAEDICDGPGTFIVSVGANAEPRLHVRSGTEHLQTVEPAAVARQGMHRFDFARLVDTLGQHPQVTVSLDEAGLLSVATIRPRRLSSGAEIHDACVVFSDAVDVPGLTALVYLTRAPWRGGHSLPVIDGRAALPPALQNSGPLRVGLRVDDPWVPEPILAWPELGSARFCDSEGWLTDGDEEEVALSAFLAGVAPLPEAIRDLSRLWTVHSVLSSLHLEERRNVIHNDVKRLLRRDPTASMQALAAGKLDVDLQPRVMIETGLVCAPLNTDPDRDGTAWSRREMLASALLAPSAREAAEATLGEIYQHLMEGSDPFREVGAFTESADMMALMSAEQRRDLTKAAAFVPSGLLSSDSRATAAMQLFEARKDERLASIRVNAHKVVEQAGRLFSPGLSDCPEGIAALNARRHPTSSGGWRAFPAVSIGLAFAARLASRGDEAATHWLMSNQLRPWADLAAVAPDLVTIDLIVAELTLHAKERVQ
ncbi:hypothetical protein GCM10027020_32360 [Nocardioides salsibiostraticola]